MPLHASSNVDLAKVLAEWVPRLGRNHRTHMGAGHQTALIEDWFNAFVDLEGSLMQKALERIWKTSQYFPKIHEVREAYEIIKSEADRKEEQERRRTDRIAIARVQPMPHVCHPEVAELENLRDEALANKRPHKEALPEAMWGHARRWLAAVAPYEALHVKCPYEQGPVCPLCGRQGPPQDHPVIQSLMLYLHRRNARLESSLQVAAALR